MRLQVAELLEAAQRGREDRNEHDAGEHDQRGEDRDGRQGARTAARRLVRRRRGGRAIAIEVSVIAHEDPSVAEGEGHADDEQHDADRRAEAETHPRDAEIIEVRDHRVRRLERTAASQAG